MARTSLSFVSQAALASGVAEGYGLHKRLAAVKACRTVKKTDMLHNDYLPVMQIDAQTYEVRADGQLLTCEPAQGAADGAALLPVLKPAGTSAARVRRQSRNESRIRGSYKIGSRPTNPQHRIGVTGRGSAR